MGYGKGITGVGENQVFVKKITRLVTRTKPITKLTTFYPKEHLGKPADDEPQARHTGFGMGTERSA